MRSDRQHFSCVARLRDAASREEKLRVEIRRLLQENTLLQDQLAALKKLLNRPLIPEARRG